MDAIQLSVAFGITSKNPLQLLRKTVTIVFRCGVLLNKRSILSWCNSIVLLIAQQCRKRCHHIVETLNDVGTAAASNEHTACRHAQVSY
jgi:hypothetical protein